MAQFSATRTLGDHWRVLVDEQHRWLTVTSSRNMAEANPDIIDFTAITGCRMDIDEMERVRQVGQGSYQAAPAYDQQPVQQETQQPVQQPMQQAAPVAGPWVCPGCGAQSEGKFCEFCGTKRP